MKRMLSLILSVILVLGLVACGDRGQDTPQDGGSGQQTDDNQKPKPNQKLDYDYSANRNSDNITFTWVIEGNTVYGINIADQDIAKDITMGREIGNEYFQLDQYADAVNSLVLFKKLGAYQGVHIHHVGQTWENKSFDPDRSIVQEKDDRLLVHEHLGGDNFTVYIKEGTDYIRVNANIRDEAAGNEFFDYVNEHINVVTFQREIVDQQYVKADLSSAQHNGQPYDISKWTFMSDVLADLFRQEGLNIRGATDFRACFTTDGARVFWMQRIIHSNFGELVFYGFNPIKKGSFDNKETIMEFEAGSTTWRITDVRDGTYYAVVETGTGVQFRAEINYKGNDIELNREKVKNAIIDYFA